jgi:hypothetical protein
MRICVLFAALILCQCSSPSEAPAIRETTTASDQDALRERARAFLWEHMPDSDREQLSQEYLAENLELALEARASFPWAASVPEALFLNDVLPYAVFDETREAWRRELLDLARPIVAGCSSASEAAQACREGSFLATIALVFTLLERGLPARTASIFST